MKPFKLSDAVRIFRYTPVISPRLERRQVFLGNKPNSESDAIMLPGRVLALRADDWRYAFAASHEIAEFHFGWVHSSDMYCLQANILSTWILMIKDPEERLKKGYWIPSI